MIAAAFLLVMAMYVFAYHYERNGNPWAIGNFAERLIWAFVFAMGFPFMAFDATHWSALGTYFAGQFVAMMIPHAFAQNMGARTMAWIDMPRITILTVFGKTITAPKYWPAYWLTPFLTKINNLTQDFLGMASVGFLRGVIVFIPATALGASVESAIAAAAVTVAAQPLAYVAGRFTPWSAFTNPPDSAQWGEFFIPVGWAIATWVAA